MSISRAKGLKYMTKIRSYVIIVSFEVCIVRTTVWLLTNRSGLPITQKYIYIYIYIYKASNKHIIYNTKFATSSPFSV